MHYSLLNEIDKYLVNNQIPFESVYINYDYLPKYVNQVILEYIRKETQLKDFQLGPLQYKLAHDNSDNLYLLAKDSNRHTNVVVTNTNTLSVDFPCYIVPEEKLIKKAIMQKYLEGSREGIRNRLNKYKILPREKIELENQEINHLIYKTSQELIDNNINIFSIVDYKTPLKKSVDSITSYIKYLFDEYIHENDKMEGIYYNEPINTGIKEYFIGTKEKHTPYIRVNMPIPIESRISILEKYKYVYKEYAYNSKSSEINYMNYLYHIKDNLYIIVLEPYNGIKHTKIITIDSSEPISKDKFKYLVRHYLELSNYQELHDKEIVRCNHTTLDKFSKVIKYVLLDVDKELNNPIFKLKVNNAKKRTLNKN